MAKTFTQKEQDILSNNPYTLNVTETTLQFTLEFKNTYWDMYSQGLGPSQILKECGYDPKMLGTARITGLSQHLREEHKKYGCFHEARPINAAKHPSKAEYEKMSQKKAMKEMQTEIVYLRQEIDFLKKLIRLEQEEK